MICVKSFLNGFREPLSKMRYELVQKAFAQFDEKGCGMASAKALAEAFNVEKYPDFYNGKCTRDEIVGEFMSHLTVNQEGMVGLDNFLAYYTDLSVGISSDEYFCDMMANTWGATQ